MSKNKKKKKSKSVPLTRWVYFTKTLYDDPSASTEFTYEKVIYVKSEELQQKEGDNKRINTLLLLALFAMFALSSKFQFIWILIMYFFLVIAGQMMRLLNLPKNILDHLEDTGRRKR
ncbi:MAG: hypothetical protein E7446_08055 [Ruminococcaceae bacterium]|nr:hypothetical protein [Oscillospiraceae bacterium]